MKRVDATLTPPIRTLKLAALVAASFAGIGAAAAAECEQPDSHIETDRPDVTNSAIVATQLYLLFVCCLFARCAALRELSENRL
jgi:hypothetical protein